MSAAPPPGRWERIAEVPGIPDVSRWRVRDADTGEEAVWLQPLGNPARQGAFVVQMQAFSDLRLPGVPAITLGTHDNRPYAVLHHAFVSTCERVAGPMPPQVVSAVGALLAPVCLSAGPAMGGVLDPRDLAMDAQGRLWYSPTARAPNRVELGTARHVDPEMLRGAPPTAESALYGLGALLYRWLTGAPLPPPGRAMPPSGSVRPDAPRGLTDAIDALLGSDPASRRRACGSFAPGPLQLHPPQESASIGVVPATVDRLPVVLRPAAVRPADLPRIVGALRLSEADVQAWHASGAPLILSVHDGIGSSDRAIELWRFQGLPAERWRLPGQMAWLGPGFAATVSLGATLVAGVGVWLDTAALGWVAGALATSFAAAAALAARQVALRTRQPVDLLGVTRPTAEGRARLRDAMRSVERAGWPDAALRDVRAVSHSLERAFDAWDVQPDSPPAPDRIPHERLLAAVALLADGADQPASAVDAEVAAQQALALVSAVRSQLTRPP